MSPKSQIFCKRGAFFLEQVRYLQMALFGLQSTLCIKLRSQGKYFHTRQFISHSCSSIVQGQPSFVQKCVRQYLLYVEIAYYLLGTYYIDSVMKKILTLCVLFALFLHVLQLLSSIRFAQKVNMQSRIFFHVQFCANKNVQQQVGN